MWGVILCYMEKMRITIIMQQFWIKGEIMNFIRLKTMTLGNIEEYVVVNMNKVEKIREKNGNLRICFNDKENNITIEDCEENRTKLGLQIGNDLIGEGLCKLKN